MRGRQKFHSSPKPAPISKKVIAGQYYTVNHSNTRLLLTASSSALSSVRRRFVVRETRAAPLEDPVMPIPGSVKVEVRRGAGIVGEHFVRVAAHPFQLAGFEDVVLVEHPRRRGVRDGALVGNGLAVVLARRFQVVHLQQPVRGGIKLQPRVAAAGDRFLHFLVLYRNGCVLDQSRVVKSGRFGHIVEVVPVQRPAQALAPQNLVLPERFRDAAVRVHVGKVQLAAGFQKVVARLQDRGFVGAQVNNAVADYHVERIRFQFRNRI